MTEQSGGRKTRECLLSWSEKHQSVAEQLAGQILKFEGFTSVDPSHPLGGPDGLKDLVAIKDGERWIAAASFPSGQQTFTDNKKKFKHDLAGVKINDGVGFAFFTNQKLTVGERKQLVDLADGPVEIYHLDRLVTILNSPQAYGVRLQHLDIEMTKEDQLSFFAWVAEQNSQVVESAFDTERKLLEHERHRRSVSALRNHRAILAPEIRLYRYMAWILTTPIEHRETNKVYNPDFMLSDMRDLFKPSLLMVFPHFEAAIDRFIKVQRSLLNELASLVKLVDHTDWPEIPDTCASIITAMKRDDYSEAILGSVNTTIGTRSEREVHTELIENHTGTSLDHIGSNILDLYLSVARQIKHVEPLVTQLLVDINGHILDKPASPADS